MFGGGRRGEFTQRTRSRHGGPRRGKWNSREYWNRDALVRTQRGILHRGRGVDTEDHGAKIEWQDELESLCSGEDTEGIITLTQKFSEKENFREKCATSVFP